MLKSIGFFEADRAMSDQNEKKEKREYRKGEPLTQVEHNKRLIAKRSASHKILRAFVPRDVVDQFKQVCHARGETMQDVIAELMEGYVEKFRE
ncbi:TPA: transcriptional regulator [Raoultella ornithinolytica]|nr:transcriptional regulator [Raoultella ornithinolytica]HAT1670147.1 transcriptional regulator [Raoultella ornithinolytica]